MFLHVVGIDYKNTPIVLREKGAFSKSRILELKKEFTTLGILEYVVVSTCNRSEIYFMVEENSYEAILNYYMTLLGVTDGRYFYAYSEDRAMEHLLRVTCGLESLVVGEDQILGQIKDSLAYAMEYNLSGKILNKIFRESINFAKRTKSEHRISENQTSVGSISIKFVEEQLGTYSGKRILIVGSGDTSELVMKYLVEKDLKSLSVINRTKCHAHRMTKKYETIEVLEYDERYAYLQDYDAIFTATSSPHVIFTKEAVEMHLAHKVIFMDLAVPRDVDARIGELEKASVYTVDDLKRISLESMSIRQSLVAEIEMEIREKVSQLLIWVKNSQLDTTIGQLKKLQQSHVEEAVISISKKLLLDASEADYMTMVFNSSIKKLFKNTIDTLKTLEHEDDIEMYQDVLTDLFQLEKVK
ncbi:MAG: glutamyl-tRNA reductase [Clostridia bacterium]|nr:glutamyl-tRNA reductase [Clostridia bacterium]